MPRRFLLLLLFFLVPADLAGLAAPSAAASPVITRTLHHGPLTVITRHKDPEADDGLDYPPRLRILDGKREVAAFVFTDDIGPLHVYIAEMDPDNGRPEVVAESYSGGAHCCTTVMVFSAPPKGSAPWRRVNLGSFDGAGGIPPVDIDGDGLSEMPLKDNSFLYQFGCYACSYAPPRILAVRGGKVVDLTRRRAMRPYLRKAEKRALARIRESMAENEGPAENGLLAGYVALKMLLGEGPQAWRFMLKHYRRDAPMILCPVPDKDGGNCLVPQIRLPFPAALAIFLADGGYGKFALYPEE